MSDKDRTTLVQRLRGSVVVSQYMNVIAVDADPATILEAADEIERLRGELAEAREVRCPCGSPYVKVSGGYVPSCACGADNVVTVATVPLHEHTASAPDSTR